MTAALSGVLVLAMGLWLWRFGGWRKGLAVACMLAAISLGAWRGLDENGSHGAQFAAGKVVWSEQQVAQLRAAGNAVFVDVTADWCITCIANETAVLHTDAMSAAFAAHGVVYMIADWTNYNAAIAGLLEQHGRTGIPLYLMYPADPSREPLILPQILTSNTVLEALRSVSDKNPDIASTM
jgi:thiol:disulfide interchange protein DsbD